MRKFLIVSGVLIFLLLAGIVVLALSPPVHKAAFLWALDGKVDDVSVEKVRITGSSFVVEDFNLIHEGVQLATDRAEVKVKASR